MIKQRTPEWEQARRTGVTSTDIPAILGISPWKSEGEVAREKGGMPPEEPGPQQARRMRLGLALEDVVKTEDELEHGIKLRRVNRLMTHPSIAWALTSLDYERIGERCIVEVKTSGSRDWQHGLPEYVEAQVRWQMGVAGYPKAHVAALRFGSELMCFDLDHEQHVFDALVVVAEDFRTRLDAGGPFGESMASVRRLYRADNGVEMIADQETAIAIASLVATRDAIADLEIQEDALKVQVMSVMQEVAILNAGRYRVTWKRSKDHDETDWKSLATGLLGQVPETERDTLVGLHTTTKDGKRPFIIKETA